MAIHVVFQSVSDNKWKKKTLNTQIKEWMGNVLSDVA